MALTIDELNIKIQSEADGAERGVDGLTDALSRLKANLNFASQLTAVATGITRISKSSGELNKVNFENFGKNISLLSKSLQPLQGFKTQASGLLTSLRDFKDTANSFNEFTGFERLASQIQTLATSLAPLNSISGKLGATLNALSQVTQISNSMNSTDFGVLSDQITNLTASLAPLGTLQSKLGSTLNQLSRLKVVAGELNSVMAGASSNTGIKGFFQSIISGSSGSTNAFVKDIQNLVAALRPLETIGKSNLGSIFNQLKKLPEIAAGIQGVDMTSFSAGIQAMSDALNPLVTQLNAVSAGFSALPQKVRAVANATDGLERSNKRASKSYGGLLTSVTKFIGKMTILAMAIKRAANVVAEWFKESSDYIENLNLFTVTMGEATDEAYAFAEAVQQAMGIDISEWMNYQGTFQQLATGFGVASDKANIMSQNLTQLAYDLSSFFNVDVETAFDKLSSGMSGQIKGLKEYGINLSVAALQEYALSKGIEQSVRTMTEAQKSILRYNLLMEKTVKIQGDMARTLVTPSNAMRILSAQVTQLKRALGNIASVLLVKLIPYIQAFVRVLTDAADALAKLWGFELPKIDYSGLSNAFADAEEDAGAVSDTVKEIKKQLMGFDELNILSSPDTSASLGSAAGGGSDWGMDLQTYDFMGELDKASDQIYNKMKDGFEKVADAAKTVFNVVEKMLPLIKGIVAGILVMKGVKWVGNIASSISSIVKSTGKIGALKKFGLAAAGLAVEVMGVYDATKQLAMGTTDAGTAFVNMAGSMAIGGAACYAALGPLGLVLAAVVAVFAQQEALDAATKEMYQAHVAENLFNGIGTSIDSVVESFKASTEGLSLFSAKISEGISNFNSSRENIKSTAGEIDNMISIIKTGSEDTVNTYVPKLIDAFGQLRTSIEGDLENTRMTLSTLFSSMPADLLEQYGISKEEVAEILNSGIDSTLAGYSKINEEISKYSGLLDEATKAGDSAKVAEYTAKLEELQQQLQSFGGEDLFGMQEVVTGIENLGKIDWSGPTEIKNAMDTLATDYASAKEQLQSTVSDLETMIEQAKFPAATEKLYKQMLFDMSAEQEKELADAYAATAGKIKTAWIDAINEQFEADRGSIPSAVFSSVFMEDPISYFKQDEKFHQNLWDAYVEYSGLADADNAIQTVANEAKGFADSFKTAGEDSVAGYREGLANAAKNSTGTTEFTDKVESELREGLDWHSPAGLFEEAGNDSVKGYAKGITDAFSTVATSWGKAFDEWFKTVKENFSSEKWQKIGEKAMSGLQKSLKMPSFSPIKLEVTYDAKVSSDKKAVADALGLSGWPNLQWKAYKDGGFPSVGEMFIANEAGPELIGRMGSRTAVANSDQIVAGIASGVYSAVSAAMRENGDSNGKRIEIRVPVEVDNRTIGEAFVEYNNGIVKQTGKSPLLV